jgi:p-hydroxybenzoate 3-monooxygenase
MSTQIHSERTQVLIVGAGPSGLLLSQALHVHGIESIVIERKDRAYVEARIRAGILETGAVNFMRDVGAAERLDRECLIHDGIEIAINGQRQKINFQELVGQTVTVYGQTEITKDLANVRIAAGGDLRYDCADVTLHDLDTAAPKLRYVKDGKTHEIAADFIAGCDGFHGVSRQSIPADRLKVFERIYPFGWLGIMSQVPPPADDLIYAQHERGFALCSMRSANLSRHYIQCRPDENLDDWPDDKIWQELAVRIGDPEFKHLRVGPLLEKSVTPMRSFVCETLRYGRLFLVGDAGHIVPPTGAKGLNLAASDVYYLVQGLTAHYKSSNDSYLDGYCERALARIWKAQRFSWWMTTMLHNFGPEEAFQDRVHHWELSYVLSSKAAQTSLAENYVGLPY